MHTSLLSLLVSPQSCFKGCALFGKAWSSVVCHWMDLLEKPPNASPHQCSLDSIFYLLNGWYHHFGFTQTFKSCHISLSSAAGLALKTLQFGPKSTPPYLCEPRVQHSTGSQEWCSAGHAFWRSCVLLFVLKLFFFPIQNVRVHHKVLEPVDPHHQLQFTDDNHKAPHDINDQPSMVSMLLCSFYVSIVVLILLCSSYCGQQHKRDASF